MSLEANKNVRTLTVLLAAVVSVQGETLYQQDGITLEGTVRMVTRGAGVCQVLAENHPPDVYEGMKANHGQPLDVWQLDFAARNGSGRRLAYLTAHLKIESEWPPCTNWTGPEGRYAKKPQWAGSFETLQRVSGMEPGEQVSDTVYVLAFHSQAPKFERGHVDYRFAAGTFSSEQTCAGKPEGAACWKELESHPGCYAWDNHYFADRTWTWTGECTDGLASGSGTLKSVWGAVENEYTGLLRAGKRNDHWVLRSMDGGVQEGPYVDGKQHGRWVERDSDGGVAEGPYVAGKRHGQWVGRFAAGRTVTLTFVKGILQR